MIGLFITPPHRKIRKSIKTLKKPEQTIQIRQKMKKISKKSGANYTNSKKTCGIEQANYTNPQTTTPPPTSTKTKHQQYQPITRIDKILYKFYSSIR